MVGDDGGSNQIGVSPGATWITAKGCESTSCSFSALLASGQWVLSPTDLTGQNPNPDLRPQIVNNSWGGGTNDPFYQVTVQAWRDSGIFPAFANGNSGPGCGSANVPGAYPESFGVGAVDINDNIAAFSSRGPATFFGAIVKPDVSAPGVNVRSSVPFNSYGLGSGTSMATPHVSGVVALVWAAIPGLVGDVSSTIDLLDATADTRDSSQCGDVGPPNNVYGWGIVNALAAVQQGSGPMATKTSAVAAQVR
jgi:subtilisin family serine protease